MYFKIIHSILLNIFLVSLRRILTLTALSALYTWKLYLTSSGTVVLLKSYGMMSQYLSQKRYSLTLFCILKM